MRASLSVPAFRPGPRVHWNGHFARESAPGLHLSHGVDADEREQRPAAAFVRARVQYSGQNAPRMTLARRLTARADGLTPVGHREPGDISGGGR